MKIKLSDKRKKILLSLLVCVIVLTGSLLLARVKQINKVYPDDQTSTITPNSTVEEYPIDMENDGVYINYEYGFKFEYPEEVFVEQVSDQGSHNVWYSSRGAISPFDVGEDGVWMTIGSGKVTPSLQKRVSDKIILEAGEPSSAGITKIRSEKNTEYEQVEYFYQTPRDRESEHGVSYGSEWIRNDIYISFEISASNESTINRYKPLFTEIVNSFEFF